MGQRQRLNRNLPELRVDERGQLHIQRCVAGCRARAQKRKHGRKFFASVRTLIPLRSAAPQKVTSEELLSRGSAPWAQAIPILRLERRATLEPGNSRIRAAAHPKSSPIGGGTIGMYA